jgi:hypothetical protein
VTARDVLDDRPLYGGGVPGVRIACLYEFEEDRLVCERVWFDFATILRQLGVLAS